MFLTLKVTAMMNVEQYLTLAIALLVDICLSWTIRTNAISALIVGNDLIGAVQIKINETITLTETGMLSFEKSESNAKYK